MIRVKDVDAFKRIEQTQREIAETLRGLPLHAFIDLFYEANNGKVIQIKSQIRTKQTDSVYREDFSRIIIGCSFIHSVRPLTEGVLERRVHTPRNGTPWRITIGPLKVFNKIIVSVNSYYATLSY